MADVPSTIAYFAGNAAQAFEVLNGMRASGLAPNVRSLNCALAACSNARDLEAAFEIFKVFTEGPDSTIIPDAISYRTLITACARKGRMRMAHKVYERMKADGHPLCTRTANAMLAACQAARDARYALCVAREMRDEGIVFDIFSYNLAISACAKGGDPLAAFDLWKQLRAEGLRIDSFTATSLLQVRFI